MLDNATPSQVEAITSTRDKIITLAGPGSGKTTTLINRIKRLISDGVEPNCIVVISFTNAAANEIKERLGMQLGYIGTVHGFGLLLLQKFGYLIGYGERITVLNDTQAADMMMEIAETMKVRTSHKRLLKVKWDFKKTDPSPGEKLVVDTYFKRLKENNLLDFDAILSETKRLIELINVHCDCFREYSHLFVDEFQDSGSVDFDIYDLLKIENKFYVGDPDQAIYGFRGGRLENILKVANDKRYQLILLEGNFRSGKKICEAAQNLIEKNTDRFSKKTIAATGKNSSVDIYNYDNDFIEANSIFQEVRSLISNGSNPNEIAVIARTNYIAEQLANHCSLYGIPVARKEIKKDPDDWQWALSTIEMLVNPDNDVVMEFWLKMKLGDKEAKKLRTTARINQTTINSVYFKPRINSVAMNELLTELVKNNVSKKSLELIEQRIKDLKTDSLLELLFAINRDSETRKEIGDGVTITTIHGSKGREWDVVFIPAWEQIVMPGKRKEVNIEEERRIAYVGITRARNRLVISCSKKRKLKWDESESEPSQFIKEIVCECKNNG